MRLGITVAASVLLTAVAVGAASAQETADHPLVGRYEGSEVEALTSDYDVSPDRLEPRGVGPLAPAATDRTEEGRAMNRRVVLVES